MMNEHGVTFGDHVLTRLASAWVPLTLALLVAVTLLLVRARRTDRGRQVSESPPVIFVLLLFGMGLLLALAVEFAFVLDLERTRANTVFKIYYQVWVLWSLASAYGVYDLLCGPSRPRSRAIRVVTGALITVSLALGLTYPILAIPTRIDNPQPTLDGIEVYVRDPGHAAAKNTYAVAQWINQNVSGAPVLLEGADGKPGYRASRSRLSSWTGLPIPIGWVYHEQQWRGTDTIQRQRTADVATIYSTLDPAVALDLLQRYKVEYVFIGDFERGLYPAKGLAKFDRMLPLIFRQGNARLYHVP